MARDKYDVLEINDRIDEIEMLYRDGSLDWEVAEYLGVSESLLHSWVRRSKPDVEKDFGKKKTKEKYTPKYKPFAEARQRGKRTSNSALENTAFRLALGMYEHEKTVHYVNEGEFEVRTYTEKLKPDVQMLWRLMYNRMPEKYRNIVNSIKEISGEGEGEMSEETFLKTLDTLKMAIMNPVPVRTEADLEDESEDDTDV